MDNVEREEYLSKIHETQMDFYKTQPKHKLFKHAQKNACANHVAESISLTQMIDCTVFNVPNTNIIYYNYLVFKTYGNTENVRLVQERILDTISTILADHDTFEFHVNLKTFSVSACYRYRSMIVESIDNNRIFTEKLNRLVVYHTPSIIDQITPLLYHSVKPFLHKIEFVKEKSDGRIAALFEEI